MPFTLDGTPSRAMVWLDGAPDAQVILARDPAPDQRRPIGDLTPPQPRTALLVRSRAASALFVSLWSFGEDAATAGAVEGTADGDVTVAVSDRNRTRRWALPYAGAVREE